MSLRCGAQLGAIGPRGFQPALPVSVSQPPPPPLPPPPGMGLCFLYLLLKQDLLSSELPVLSSSVLLILLQNNKSRPVPVFFFFFYCYRLSWQGPHARDGPRQDPLPAAEGGPSSYSGSGRSGPFPQSKGKEGGDFRVPKASALYPIHPSINICLSVCLSS